MPHFDIQAIRAQFPALTQQIDGRPVVFLDNPGGTQVPQTVIDAMSAYLQRDNANRGGPFATSQRSDAMLDEAHAAMADLLGAASPDEIVFGANMTTLTFSLSRAIGRTLGSGDEIILTRLDHDANITPWVLMAEERGITVRWADFHPADCTLDMAGLHALINERTRLICVGLASNATGTINDVAKISRWAHAVGAHVFVDAVHYVPHGPVDVQTLGCDFLACSVYKFYGPHVGVLYGRYALLDKLRAYKVRPAHDSPPGKFETGTQNHEGIAGALAAVDYLASLGVPAGGSLMETDGPGQNRRRRLHAALSAIHDNDRQLTVGLLSALEGIPGLAIHGITDPQKLAWRVPTVSFTLDGHHPATIAAALGQAGIFVWHGNLYALAVTERLGLEARGGMVRVGAAHYNTPAEIVRFGETLRRWLAAQE